jgi:hypothetical protein
MTRNGLGYILGDFFTNSSGHPVPPEKVGSCCHLTNHRRIWTLITGLPYLSWYNIPKRGKYTRWPLNLRNDHKTYVHTNGHKMYQHFQIQGPPKIYLKLDLLWCKDTIWQPCQRGFISIVHNNLYLLDKKYYRNECSVLLLRTKVAIYLKQIHTIQDVE